jgi:hydrogenase expression/formation protein HypE
MNEKITLDHGSGGRASHELITGLFLRVFNNRILAPMEDSAVMPLGSGRIAFSTDSFVVDPIFFPGGNIGDLAVNGTVNDLAMRGARPLYLSVAMIIEEGFLISDLEKIIRSIKKSADIAGVEIVTGDTKVVPQGKADKIFINTSGIGVLEQNFDISAANAAPGDQIILSGTMADHGVTIMSMQEGLRISGAFQSDSAALNHIIQKLLAQAQGKIHVLRDPTRGGVATTLNEIAASSKVGIRLKEEALPIRNDVRGACELLGLDPLYLANEGKFLLFAEAGVAQKILQMLRADALGRESEIIGEVTAENPGKVLIDSPLGTSRLLDMLHGTPLPRIC